MVDFTPKTLTQCHLLFMCWLIPCYLNAPLCELSYKHIFNTTACFMIVASLLQLEHRHHHRWCHRAIELQDKENYSQRSRFVFWPCNEFDIAITFFGSEFVCPSVHAFVPLCISILSFWQTSRSKVKTGFIRKHPESSFCRLNEVALPQQISSFHYIWT